MRVAFRAEHRFLPDACVEHVMSARGAVMGTTAALAGAGSRWGTQVADIVSRCALERPTS
jgi:hypothetical protein